MNEYKCSYEYTGLLCTCSNHLTLVSTVFSTIGTTPTLSDNVMNQNISK